MKNFIKAFCLLGVFTQVQLCADFLGTMKSNVKVSESFSTSNIGSLSGVIKSGSIGGIIDGYTNSIQDSILGSGASAVTDAIFGSDFGTWWSGNNSWTTSTMKMCYKYNPNYQPSDTTPNLCGLFSNTTLDPCSALPNTLGPFKKLSQQERWNTQLPFKDWCEEYTNSIKEKISFEEATKQITLTGKNQAGTKDTNFNSEVAKKAEKETAAQIDKFKTANKENTLGKAINALNKNEKGYIAKSYIDSLTKLSGEVDPNKELKKEDVKIPYESLQEYNDDTHYHASKYYGLERELAFTQHLDIAESKFKSINSTNIASKSAPSETDFQQATQEKITFISNYIDKKSESAGDKKGYRELAQEWAEGKAKEEIEFELPMQLGNMYYIFNESIATVEKSPGTNDPVSNKIAFIYKIKRQQYFESKIMQKWRRKADEKADLLKTLMHKRMIASELFNVAKAKAEVYAIIGGN